jgi:hypothetical protein
MLHRLRLLLLISLLQESIEGSLFLCKCAEGQENERSDGNQSNDHCRSQKPICSPAPTINILSIEVGKSSGSEKLRFKMYKR